MKFGIVMPLWLFLLSAPIFAQKKIAFLGDSLSTGAVTHPSLEFSKPHLWKVLRGQLPVTADTAYMQETLGEVALPDVKTPKRLWPSFREYLNPMTWFGQQMLSSVSRIYLDTEQYSWANLLGRRLGYASEDILIAAHDGARVRDAVRQLDRVLNVNDHVLPEKIFMFFSGNDLCGHTMEYVTSTIDYGAHLKAALQYLLRNGKVPESGTDVYVVSFLGILQLTGNQSILDKKVPAFGQVLTCKELVAGKHKPSQEDEVKFLEENPEASFFLGFFPSSPASMCPSVYEQNIDKQEDQRNVLGNRIRSFRDVQQKAVRELSQRISKTSPNQSSSNVRMHFVNETADLNFDGPDIANDCFHLSLKGQDKVAQAVAEGLGKL